jgi:hypothetical protein
MDMSRAQPIPASEFTRNFGRYRMQAQREAIAVSSHGQIIGYFVPPDEYEAFLRNREQRRSFAAADLTADEMDAISRACMDPKHDHLNTLLDWK